MTKRRHTNIKYAYKYQTDPDTGFIELDFATKAVSLICVKNYENHMHKTASLTPAARNLLDYLVQNMNKQNEIGNTHLVRSSFLHFMSKNCGVNYAEETVNKGFQELKAADLLISFDKKRGVYVVNPLYYFRGNEDKRKSLLQSMLNKTPQGKYAGTNLKKALGV